jgi:hypothetical protein
MVTSKSGNYLNPPTCGGFRHPYEARFDEKGAGIDRISSMSADVAGFWASRAFGDERGELILPRGFQNFSGG